MDRFRRLWQLLRRRRRKVALLVALVGVLLVGSRLAGAVPRDVAIEYRLESQRPVQEVRIAYILDGEEVVGARFEGPGSRVSHEVSLPPGRYRVEALVRDEGTQRLVRRALRVPAAGIVYIDLSTDHRRLQPEVAR